MTQTVLVAHSFLTKTVELVFEYFRSLNEQRRNNKEIRITIKELSKLSDRELKDIGIPRGDIWYVAHNQNDNLRGWV